MDQQKTSQKSAITSRPRDCMACRMIGGIGITGVGLYIGKQAFGMKTRYSKVFMLTTAFGFGSLGVARLLDLPPFNSFTENTPV